jgi:methionine-rich copper-binding protein CopC
MPRYFMLKRSRIPASLIFSSVFLFLLVLPPAAFAHAVLQSSTPAAKSVVRAGVAPVVLTFNSRVDAVHSSLSLLKDGQIQQLVIDAKAAPNVLRAHTSSLSPGHYVLRWQAVASDGHITRGEVPFDVK